MCNDRCRLLLIIQVFHPAGVQKLDIRGVEYVVEELKDWSAMAGLNRTVMRITESAIAAALIAFNGAGLAACGGTSSPSAFPNQSRSDSSSLPVPSPSRPASGSSASAPSVAVLGSVDAVAAAVTGKGWAPDMSPFAQSQISGTLSTLPGSRVYGQWIIYGQADDAAHSMYYVTFVLNASGDHCTLTYNASGASAGWNLINTKNLATLNNQRLIPPPDAK